MQFERAGLHFRQKTNVTFSTLSQLYATTQLQQTPAREHDLGEWLKASEFRIRNIKSASLNVLSTSSNSSGFAIMRMNTPNVNVILCCSDADAGLAPVPPLGVVSDENVSTCHGSLRHFSI